MLDFDGIIVDTETPLFQAWAHTYETFGAVPIEHADWCTSLGRNERDPLYLDPLKRLLDHVGDGVTANRIQSVRRAERRRQHPRRHRPATAARDRQRVGPSGERRRLRTRCRLSRQRLPGLDRLP